LLKFCSIEQIEKFPEVKSMTNSSIGMGEQDQAEREKFENELNRIIEASDNSGVILRVIGSLAFQMHCPKYGYLQAALGRAYTDIDFAGYRKQTKEVKDLMIDLGYGEYKEVSIMSEGDRAIFNHENSSLHVDVFFDKLDFSHVINWDNRLEVDHPTIPLSELLLEKMQIYKINEKDIIDTIMLLLEHPLGDNDDEVINIERIAQLLARDWGLWRTTTMNLDKVKQMAGQYSQIEGEQQTQIVTQVETAKARIEAEPKSRGWRLRDRVGDRVKWYKEVDEVE
jgi:hypothetical protein